MYEKFARLLEETHKTPYQVSKDTGIATATFTEWKNGKYSPKVDKLMTLSDYFNVPLEYFLKKDGD